MNRLRNNSIVDEWGTVIRNYGEKATRVAEIIMQDLKRIPSNNKRGPWNKIEIYEADVAGFGGLAAYVTEKRSHVVVKWHTYRLYICVRAYSTDLDISWYLIYKPGFWRRLIGIDFRTLSFFHVEDLRAFTTVVHQSVLHAVDIVLQEAGLDSSKINKNSKGFLNIS